MRVLSAALTAAQQSATATPYVKVVLSSRDRATVRTYTTQDEPNRLLGVQQAEGRFGAQLQVSDSGFPIAAVIQLHDFDSTINALDFKGCKADISWGYDTATGVDSSTGPPVYVMEQRSASSEGLLVVELYCMSMWGLLHTAWEKQTQSVRIHYAKDVTVRHILMELMGGRFTPFGSSAVKDDGGVYTSMASEALDPTDASDLGGVNDVLIAAATPAANDAFYIGDVDQFERVSFDLTLLWSAAGPIGAATWEYWDGSSWSTLTVTNNMLSGNNPFGVGELKTVTFTKPTDWAAVDLSAGGAGGVGPDNAFRSSDGTAITAYYIRIRLGGVAAHGGGPAATKIVLHHDFSISLDSSDGNQGDDDKIEYTADYGQSIISIIQDILAHSLLGIRAESDGFHVIFVDDGVASADYTYGGVHSFFVHTLRDTLIVPNKIIYTNLLPGEVETVTRFQGSDENTASSDQLGTVTQVIVEKDLVTSTATGDTLAARAITRLLRDRAQGVVEAPLNCGQEVWDQVEVADARSGQTYTGRVSQIIRTFEPGVYRISISMGSVVITAPPIRGVLAQSLGLEAVAAQAPTLTNQETEAAIARFNEAVASMDRHRLTVDPSTVQQYWHREPDRTARSLDFVDPSTVQTGIENLLPPPITQRIQPPSPMGAFAARPTAPQRTPAPSLDFVDPSTVQQSLGPLLLGGLSPHPPSSSGLSVISGRAPASFGPATASPWNAATLAPRAMAARQAENQSRSGRWLGGDGAVVIDSSGITLITNTANMTFEDGSGTAVGDIRGDTAAFHLRALNSSDLFLTAASGREVIVQGDLKLIVGSEFRIASGSGYVGFEATASMSTQVIFQLPNADGSADQILKTNGSKVLAWVGPPLLKSGDTSYMTGPLGIGGQPIADSEFHLRGVGATTTTWTAYFTNDTTGHTSGNGFRIQQVGAGPVSLFNEENNDLHFGTNGAHVLTLDPNGHVISEVAADLGDGGKYWARAYITIVDTDQLIASNGGVIDVTGRLDPTAATYDFGTASDPWRDLYLSRFVEFVESAPAPGAANTGRLYVEDNGSGKTRLVVVFNSGVAQVIATEP